METKLKPELFYGIFKLKNCDEWEGYYLLNFIPESGIVRFITEQGHRTYAERNFKFMNERIAFVNLMSDLKPTSIFHITALLKQQHLNIEIKI